MVEPSWLLEARKHLGVKEVKGEKHNPTILDYWRNIRLSGIKNDEIPWCAAFVGAMLERVGIKSTRSESARSYLKWGIELKKPCVGAIVIFWRGSITSVSGHVAIVTGQDSKGNLVAIGGNQNDEVNEAIFNSNRVLSYRWPNEAGFQTSSILPIRNLNKPLSTNEA